MEILYKCCPYNMIHTTVYNIRLTKFHIQQVTSLLPPLFLSLTMTICTSEEINRDQEYKTLTASDTKLNTLTNVLYPDICAMCPTPPWST